MTKLSATQKNQLICKFNEYVRFSPADKNHAAACAIHEVLFKSDNAKWNKMTTDLKLQNKYWLGLLVLANAGLITVKAG